MKNRLLTSILILFVTLTYAQRETTFLADSLDNYINTNLAKWKLPGLSIAIVKKGEVVHLK